MQISCLCSEGSAKAISQRSAKGLFGEFIMPQIEPGFYEAELEVQIAASVAALSR
jgi:hypothetical protein